MATHAVVAPRTAVVVGAGIVGLSTAWHLQEHGIEVTVLERGRVASGASWGNAGWLSPGLAIPLNEPSAIRAGAESLFNPYAPCPFRFLRVRPLYVFLLLSPATSPSPHCNAPCLAMHP